MSPATRERSPMRVAQAWVELRTDDPEAVSALAVVRARLAVGRELKGLRRLRLFELRGQLPTRPRLERLLHASIQFYNPHKERCSVRTSAREAPPVPTASHVVVVTERGEPRRRAAERWWFHETGRDIEVREGIVWVLEFDSGSAGEVEDLVVLRDRDHGLLCNPHAQDARIATGRVPLPWIGPPAREGA